MQRNQTTIRLRFLALYIVSLLLVFIVGKAFWEEADTIRQEGNNITSAPAVVPVDNSSEIANLKAALQQREAELAQLKNNPQPPSAQKGNSIVAMQNQEKALADKDRIIAELENKLLNQKSSSPIQQTNSAGNPDKELQAKYQSLKTAYDKKVANEKTMSNAYQSLVDDNKRLLSQLQSLKKG